MKNIILLLILLISERALSQDCNKASINVSDFVKFRKFLEHSPIHEPLNENNLKYNSGISNYFPTEKHVPWGGYYMPYVHGGLANRWQECRTCHATSTTLFTMEQVKKMSTVEIAKLSPIEKLDIYLDNPSLFFTENELKNRGPERPIRIIDTVVNGVARKDTIKVEDWEGFCNGMRAAGALLPEPEHTIVVKSKNKNADIYVTFYPADLKALAAATYFYGEYGINIGENGKCSPNAGVFDIVLREALGSQKRTFFIDVSPNNQKWNESIVGYERKILNDQLNERFDGTPEGTHKAVRVSVSLYLLGELDITNKPTSSEIANKNHLNKWICQYVLFVDKNNAIVGGKWEKFYNTNPKYSWQNYSHPDYIWFVSGEGTDWLNWKKDGFAYYTFYDVANLVYLSTK